MSNFSDFIVYADESGDHGMVSIDPQYPVFALVFCVMRKTDYISKVVPAMQQFKFDIWGHDSIILHEREIRKTQGPFATLRTNQKLRERFFHNLNVLIETSPMKLFASIIDKKKLLEMYSDPFNLYEIALSFCMEQLHRMLTEQKEHGKSIHVVFESRGKKEDNELELEFRRIAGNKGRWGSRHDDFSNFDLQPVFVPKSANSSGL